MLDASLSPADLSRAPTPHNRHSFDYEACQELMRGGSKTFFAASRLLPQRVRGPAIALYAFCRVADDAIDLSDDRDTALRGLVERLHCVYADMPRDFEADRALAAVVREFALPRELLTALLEGFQWDAEGRRYETLEDLQAYGARVAGTVGAMMAVVMRARSPEALARACDLGVAMQLTNIARDVGEDARAGRLYLPLSWLREAGIDPDTWLLKPVFDARIAAIVKRLLDAAQALYLSSEQGIALLPRDCRPAIMAARRVYAEIGHELARMGLDSVNHRAVVSGRRKLALLALSSRSAISAPRADGMPAPALAATQFLVDAAAVRREPAQETARETARKTTGETARATGGAGTDGLRHRLDDRLEWGANLFARLSEQDQQRAQQRVAARYARMPAP